VLIDEPAEAIKHLGEATMLPELNAGAFHGLGLAILRQKKHKQAARYLIQSLQAVDTSLATDMDEVAGPERCLRPTAGDTGWPHR
jgi:Tfp pilus assembly protein PilF